MSKTILQYKEFTSSEEFVHWQVQYPKKIGFYSIMPLNKSWSFYITGISFGLSGTMQANSYSSPPTTQINLSTSSPSNINIQEQWAVNGILVIYYELTDEQ